MSISIIIKHYHSQNHNPNPKTYNTFWRPQRRTPFEEEVQEVEEEVQEEYMAALRASNGDLFASMKMTVTMFGRSLWICGECMCECARMETTMCKCAVSNNVCVCKKACWERQPKRRPPGDCGGRRSVWSRNRHKNSG